MPDTEEVPIVVTSYSDSKNFITTYLETILPKRITEAAKADVKEPNAKYTERKYGEEHPDDYALLEEIYLKVPIVYGAINKTVNACVGPGFKVSSENKQASDLLNRFIRTWNFDIILRQVVRDILIYGTSFLEIVKDGGNVAELRPITPKWMYVRRAPTGEIEGYTQWLGGTSPPKNFTTSEILQLNHNVVGNKAYGTSIISPLIKALETKLNVEKIAFKIYQRKANAVWHVAIGSETFKPSAQMLRDFKASLEDIREDQEWVTRNDVAINVLSSEGKVLDPVPLLQHFQEQLLFGLEVPAVLMGVANVAEGLAVAQKAAFDQRIESIQQSVESGFEITFFPEVLLANGMQADVEFEWRSPSKEDIWKEIDVLKGLLGMTRSTGGGGAFGAPATSEPTFPPEINDRIVERIVQLLDLGPIGATKEEEAEEPQPRVPGSNKPTEHLSFPKDIITHVCEARSSDDMSINEWVNFNFAQYKQAIERFIDSDDFLKREFVTFRFLPETNQKEWVEVKAAYDLTKVLNEEQAGTLREILKKAFKENQSIRAIAKQIENKVKPGSMTLDVAGKTMTVGNAARSLTIARTETIRASNEGALAHYEDNEIDEVSWVSSIGDRTCEYCETQDGEVFSVEDAHERIPAHVMCRCTFSPVVKA